MMVKIVEGILRDVVLVRCEYSVRTADILSAVSRGSALVLVDLAHLRTWYVT